MTITENIPRHTAVAAVLALGVAGLATPAVASAPSGSARCDRTETRRALDRMTRVHKLPGMTVRIDDPRCGTWKAAGGVADLRSGRPMGTDERSRIASVTKTFTATVMLQLAAEGRLSLDAPVERHLPGLIRKGPYDGRTISLRSLLNHTSGLPDHMEALEGTEWRFRHFEPEELVDLALRQAPPAEGWHYSTTNYVLAGMIIEKVTGRSAEREVERRIIKPLGLRDTYWPGDSIRIRGPHPRGYVRTVENGAVRWTDVTEMNISAGGVGGALISTTRDVNRFFGALLGGRLLPPAQLAEMKRTVALDPDRVWEGASYGLGLIGTTLRCGGDWWGHAGNIEGFTALGGVGPDGRRVALQANESPSTKEAHDDYLGLVQTALCEGAA